MSTRRKVDRQTEAQIVAMLARGDTLKQVKQWLSDEKNIELSLPGISVIKNRNTESLEFMQKELIKHQTTAATALLQKSRMLIDKKLDKAMSIEDDMRKVQKLLDDGEITFDDYRYRMDVLVKSQLTITEINSVSKESFHQAQLEANKPTSITESPEQAKQNLATLLKAISDGDGQQLMKSIFLND